MKLKQQLGVLDIFSISTGAMISSGIFILPGLAFARTGPSVFIAYFLAGLLALTGMFSVAELATAMPKAGGDYYFVARSMGPFIGTISGFLSWFALSLKTAFAILGLAEVIFTLTGLNTHVLAVGMCAIFLILNILGVKDAAILEITLVVGMLALMTAFIGFGLPNVQIASFDPFLSHGIHALFSTAGFVFVSFGGLLKATSVSEEAKNPTRTIPTALIASIITVTVVYTLMLIVTVGVLPAGTLGQSFTPIADAARIFAGTPGYVAMTIAALLAFITTANAGIMAASRYPLALSRDQLLPSFLSAVHPRFQTPVISILLTGAFILFALLLPLETLVKAASTVILSTYVLTNLSIIILHESLLQNYRPSFKVPFYPWTQIISMILFGLLIVEMGAATVEISVSLVLIGASMYLLYGRRRKSQEYALLHLIERLTNKQLTTYDLEDELRGILQQRDEIIHDQFDEFVKTASVIDEAGPLARDQFFTLIAEHLAQKSHLDAPLLQSLLQEREQESSTVITPAVAIPHLVVEGHHIFSILIARCKSGVQFEPDTETVKAVFVILGTKDERNTHLKALAAIAQIVQAEDFETRWLNAKDERQLRDILLLSQRKRGEARNLMPFEAVS